MATDTTTDTTASKADWEDELEYLGTEIDYHRDGCDMCIAERGRWITCKDMRGLVAAYNIALMNYEFYYPID